MENCDLCQVGIPGRTHRGSLVSAGGETLKLDSNQFQPAGSDVKPGLIATLT